MPFEAIVDSGVSRMRPVSMAAVTTILGMTPLFLGFAVVISLRFLFTAERVTGSTIWASLCVYLLPGVLWASAYSVLDILHPGSFTFTLGESGGAGAMRLGGEQSIFPLYFSFVTITTTGYGDIIPTSAEARMLAVLESVTGQLYLAVLVARLVGLHISQSTRNVETTD